MNKILFVLFCMCTAVFTSDAQPLKFGFTGGLAFANYQPRVYKESQKGDSKTGITAGLFVDFPLNTHFSFQPALNFVQKGTAERNIYLGLLERTSLRINCTEIPLNFLYKAPGTTGNFFIGAGPSFAFHVSGKQKNNVGSQSFSSNIEFGNSEEEFLRRKDIGANFLTGYSFLNGLMLAFNYNRGINNLFTDKNDSITLKSNYIAIKLGFLLYSMRERKYPARFNLYPI